MQELDLSSQRRSWYEVRLQVGINYVRRVVFLRVNHIDIDLGLEDVNFLLENLEGAREKLLKRLNEQHKLEGPSALSHLKRLEKEDKERKSRMQSP